MDSIEGFLERYKNFIPPPLAAARAVRDAIRQALKIEIPEESIRISHGRASVHASALEKTEILMHKREILTETHVHIGEAVREIK